MSGNNKLKSRIKRRDLLWYPFTSTANG